MGCVSPPRQNSCCLIDDVELGRLRTGVESCHTLDTDFCLVALEEALNECKPEIFNCDQGAPIHQSGVHRPIGAGWVRNPPGWAGTRPGQRVYRATAADGEVRGRFSEGVRLRGGIDEGVGRLLQVLQPQTSTPQLVL